MGLCVVCVIMRLESRNVSAVSVGAPRRGPSRASTYTSHHLYMYPIFFEFWLWFVGGLGVAVERGCREAVERLAVESRPR
jgi:hypothetical protein